MNRRAVLDACVLVPYNLASLLLTFGEHELIQPRWSTDILEEARRTLTTKIGLNDAAATRRLNAMVQAFPEAEVVGYQPHIDYVECHPKDRHVLAAAIAADADVIVTFNLQDFPAVSCEPHGVTAVHPEEFLLELLADEPAATLDAVAVDAFRRTNPPTDPVELLGRLTATVPTFANTAYQELQETEPVGDIPAYVIADPSESPLAALADKTDLSDPLHVAALWWLAVLDRVNFDEVLQQLTHDPRAWGDFGWAVDLLTGKSIASKVYYAVDAPTEVAVVRFVPEVATTVQAFGSFRVRGVEFLTLRRYDDGTWRAWGLGPRMVCARDVLS